MHPLNAPVATLEDNQLFELRDALLRCRSRLGLDLARAEDELQTPILLREAVREVCRKLGLSPEQTERESAVHGPVDPLQQRLAAADVEHLERQVEAYDLAIANAEDELAARAEERAGVILVTGVVVRDPHPAWALPEASRAYAMGAAVAGEDAMSTETTTTCATDRRRAQHGAPEDLADSREAPARGEWATSDDLDEDAVLPEDLAAERRWDLLHPDDDLDDARDRALVAMDKEARLFGRRNERQAQQAARAGERLRERDALRRSARLQARLLSPIIASQQGRARRVPAQRGPTRAPRRGTPRSRRTRTRTSPQSDDGPDPRWVATHYASLGGTSAPQCAVAANRESPERPRTRGWP